MDSARPQRIGRKAAGDWSAVVVNYNGDPFLAACLEAIGSVRLRPKDVFVVDNASTDGSLYEMNAYPWAETLQLRTNLGFAGGANAGLARVETGVAVVLNPDVELFPDFGDELVRAFDENPKLGAAGALLTYPDGLTVQHAGGVIRYPLLDTDHRGRGEALNAEMQRRIPIDFATGAAIGLRMAALHEAGGFDEQFAPVYYEDVDLSIRIRELGWDVELVPGLRALHHEGVSLDYDPSYYVYLHRNRIRYALKHLSHREWTTAFVPAELDRIRHELASPSEPGIPEAVGVEGIEMLLRDLEPLAAADSALLSVPPFPDANLDLDELRELRVVEGRPVRSRVPLIGWLRNWINNLGPRWYVDAALADQRAFNDAVVRALEAQTARNAQQDRLSREQTAASLLLALTMLGRLRGTDRDSGVTENSA
ncbi:hypothetical protein BH23CHL2_BH23CHL2_28980 [soil metagenome]